MAKNSLSAIIRELSYQPAKRMQTFRELDLDMQCKVLKNATVYMRKDIFKKMTDDEIRIILEQLDPVESTDLLQLLPKKRREQIIETLNEYLKRDLALLLSFDPDTAAGLMSLDYIQVSESDTIREIAEKVRTHEQRTGKVPTILVMAEDKLVGYLPGYKLVLSKPGEKADEHIKKIATLEYSATEHEVVNFFRSHPHSKIVVLGERENVLGVIYSDDIIRILQEQESSSLYDFAGVTPEESIYDPVKRKVKFRYKWLIINLGTAFLAAFTVGLFEGTIARQVLLAVYMPIVAGMGGNAATQTLAVMVRGLSLQELGRKEIWHVLKNEVGASLTNGLINGAIVFGIVSVFNHNMLVATVLGIAMVVNLLIAATFGTLVPVVMHRLGKDPASSATIFITTATDIFGFLAFLGLATILL